MANFNEHSLEMSIMELFQDEGYIYLNGEQIHRERSEVPLPDQVCKGIKTFVTTVCHKDGIITILMKTIRSVQ